MHRPRPNCDSLWTSREAEARTDQQVFDLFFVNYRVYLLAENGCVCVALSLGLNLFKLDDARFLGRQNPCERSAPSQQAVVDILSVWSPSTFRQLLEC